MELQGKEVREYSELSTPILFYLMALKCLQKTRTYTRETTRVRISRKKVREYLELSTPITFLLESIAIFTENKDFSRERQQEIELQWKKV